MKKILLLILIILSFNSCSVFNSFRITKQYPNIEHDFIQYIDYFVVSSDGKVTWDDFDNFTMGFSQYPSDSNVIGTCYPLLNEVSINQDWWEYSSTPNKRLAVVFHELGHCILKRNHTAMPDNDGFVHILETIAFKFGFLKEKSTIKDGCPASIMNPVVLSDECLDWHYRYYIKELFNNN